MQKGNQHCETNRLFLFRLNFSIKTWVNSEIDLLFLSSEFPGEFQNRDSWMAIVTHPLHNTCYSHLSLTSSNFQIYQTIQLCQSHSVTLTFPTVSLRGLCNLHEQIVAKLDFFLFIPDLPFLSGYYSRRAYAQSHQDHPLNHTSTNWS